MKKKLFLFITCFFFCSAAVTFLYLQNRKPSSEVTENKKENENEKKKLEDQKEKSDSNQEEKPEENKANQEDNQKNNQEDNFSSPRKLICQEETDELPWQFTWKGATVGLVSTILMECVFAIIICFQARSRLKKDDIPLICFTFLTVLFFFYVILFPFMVAINKIKNKSYWERYILANSPKIKIISNIIISTLVIVLMILERTRLLELTKGKKADGLEVKID